MGARIRLIARGDVGQIVGNHVVEARMVDKARALPVAGPVHHLAPHTLDGIVEVLSVVPLEVLGEVLFVALAVRGVQNRVAVAQEGEACQLLAVSVELQVEVPGNVHGQYIDYLLPRQPRTSEARSQRKHQGTYLNDRISGMGMVEASGKM